MNAEKRKALVALVRKIDDLESELRAANAELDRFVEGVKEKESLSDAKVTPSNGSKPPNKTLLDYVAAHGSVDYGQVAKIVYGEDTKKNRDNVTAKLYYLKKKGWIKKGDGRNEWEVLTPAHPN